MSTVKVKLTDPADEYRGYVVHAYYDTLLHRTPAEAEKNGWVSSGLDFTRIRVAIAASQEFFRRRVPDLNPSFITALYQHTLERPSSSSEEELWTGRLVNGGATPVANGIERWGQVWCPHTATAVHVRERLSEPDWIIVSTAHPAKFDSIVEPLIKQTVPIPSSLAAVFERPSRFEEIEPTFEALREALS